MTCTNCRASVPEGQKFCDHCGAPMQPAQATEPKPPAARWVAALVVLLVTVGLLGYRLYFLNRPAQRTGVTLQETPVPPPAPPVAAPPPAPEPAAPPTIMPEPPAPVAPPAARETPRLVEKRATRVTPQAASSTPLAVAAPQPVAAPPKAAQEPPPPESEREKPRPARKGIVPFQPDTSEPAPPPRTAAPAEPAAEPPTTARAPERPAPYQGPSAGTLIWSGQIEKGLLVKIEGDQVSVGRLTGELPGVPVTIELQTDAFAIVEGPSPANNWKRLYLRSVKRIRSAVVIKWVVR